MTTACALPCLPAALWSLRALQEEGLSDLMTSGPDPACDGLWEARLPSLPQMLECWPADASLSLGTPAASQTHLPKVVPSWSGASAWCLGVGARKQLWGTRARRGGPGCLRPASQLSASSSAQALTPSACLLSALLVSDSLGPHGLQPSRLLCPQDLPQQESWNRLPFPPPGDLPNPGIGPVSLVSPALAGRFFIAVTPGNSTDPPGFLLKKHPACCSFLESLFPGTLACNLTHREEKQERIIPSSKRKCWLQGKIQELPDTNVQEDALLGTDNWHS